MLKINKFTFFFWKNKLPSFELLYFNSLWFQLKEIVNGINFKGNHLPLIILF